MTYSSQQARQMGINKHLANQGEQQAANALRQIGVLMVEKIGTPFHVIKKKGDWYQGFWEEKVSGDLRGHTIDGISVLAEVKTVWDRNLRWSDLDDHQPERLSLHAEHAISLLVWIHHSGIYIMNWFTLIATDVFEPGKSLTVEQAQKLMIEML